MLVELLVTLSVIVILLALGSPGFGYLVAHNTRTTEVNALIGALNFARSQAIYRARPVTLCPVNPGDPGTCTETSWSDGYAAVDEDAAEAFRVWRPSGGIHIRSTSNFARGVRFQDNGAVRGAAGGSFYFCVADDSVEPRRLVVSGLGRILTSDDATCDGSG